MALLGGAGGVAGGGMLAGDAGGAWGSLGSGDGDREWLGDDGRRSSRSRVENAESSMPKGLLLIEM